MEDQRLSQKIMVLDVEGPRLDAANAQVFRDLVGAAIDGGNGRIVLNLAAVQFMDSSGIGVMVGLLKRAGGRGDLALAALTPTVQKAFRLTRMERIFSIYPDIAAAVAAIEAQ